MRWESEAEEAMGRVPALLRRFVRGRVEAYARERGLDRVTRDTVEQARRASVPGQDGAQEPDPAVVERLERELLTTEQGRRATRTYEVRVCAGAVGCPRSLIPVAEVAEALVEAIESSGFPAWLAAGRAGLPLLSHHRFKAAVAGCPNACSQPQIHDFGVIGRTEVAVAPDLCRACGQCLLACHEQALFLDDGPRLRTDRCLGCADCARACPTGALVIGGVSVRVVAGGKLGRHPRLAEEIATCSASEAPARLARMLSLLMARGEPGERLGEALGAETEVRDS